MTCLTRSFKSKLDALCTDIATHLEHHRSADGGVHPTVDEVSYRSMSALPDWWPSGLGRPGSGRCAERPSLRCFPETRRLVLDDHGTISIYDTGIIEYSASLKLRVASKLSRSRARMVS